MSETGDEPRPYEDVPEGYYVREDPDYGEMLVPISAKEDDLREQVFGTVAVWHSTLPLEHLQALVDAVLALPALRESAGAVEAVKRVEALAEEAESRLDWHLKVWMQGEDRYVPLARLRLALDGTDG